MQLLIKLITKKVPQISIIICTANQLKSSASKSGKIFRLQNEYLKEQMNQEEILEATWEKNNIFQILI